jgi:hypothetical protein
MRSVECQEMREAVEGESKCSLSEVSLNNPKAFLSIAISRFHANLTRLKTPVTHWIGRNSRDESGGRRSDNDAWRGVALFAKPRDEYIVPHDKSQDDPCPDPSRFFFFRECGHSEASIVGIKILQEVRSEFDVPYLMQNRPCRLCIGMQCVNMQPLPLTTSTAYLVRVNDDFGFGISHQP